MQVQPSKFLTDSANPAIKLLILNKHLKAIGGTHDLVIKKYLDSSLEWNDKYVSKKIPETIKQYPHKDSMLLIYDLLDEFHGSVAYKKFKIITDSFRLYVLDLYKGLQNLHNTQSSNHSTMWISGEDLASSLEKLRSVGENLVRLEKEYRLSKFLARPEAGWKFENDFH